jgi:deoxyribonuclease V
MIFAVDVGYGENCAIAAGVGFQNWGDSVPMLELTTHFSSIADYIPGQFYQRELPCLLGLLEKLAPLPQCIVIDGYVYLDQNHTPGLGHHLYEALGRASVVIGVAKSRFKDTPPEAALRRGDSTRPLYVTAIGISTAEAKRNITQMHGAYRFPTLLKRVDQLSKQDREC